MIKNSAKNRYVLQFYYGKITNAALAHKKVGALSPHKGSERPLCGEEPKATCVTFVLKILLRKTLPVVADQ